MKTQRQNRQSGALGMATALATLYALGTVIVNTAMYTGLAAVEGIERLCGSHEQHSTATLVKKAVALGPNSAQTPYFIFKFPDGNERTISGNPVVTKGRFFPNFGEKMVEGKRYDVATFGSKVLGDRLIGANPIN